MQTVDVWTQILTERMARAPWMASLLRWIGREGELVLPGVEGTLAAMDEAGVGVSILSAWYGPEGALIANEDVAAQMEQAPERFRALASFDLSRPAGENAREIRDWLARPGFAGVRVVPWLWGMPPNDRRYYPVFAVCEEAGVPVCTQIGHTGPLKTSQTGRLIPYLEDVLLDFPDLKIVGGHVGYPWVDELTSLTLKFPNLYADTSAYALHRLPEDFVRYMNGPGRGRVMFGTNWPMISPAYCLKGLEKLQLDEAAAGNFLSGTARKVFAL